MIPSFEEDLFDEDLEDEDDELEPSKTYSMSIETNRLYGYKDSIEAVEQSIYKTLNTERYEYVIYSWMYGIETLDLIGEDDTFVIPELQRRIEDAFSVDERIIECRDFNFEKIQKNAIHVKFIAATVFGDIEIEKVVNLDV